MRWNRPPAAGESPFRTSRCFAWFPTRMSSGLFLWLEYYERVDEWMPYYGDWIERARTAEEPPAP